MQGEGVDGSTPVEVSAARFRALGDPTRLRIIRELSAGTRCVCELRDRIGITGPLLSHHLSVLRGAGIVTASRRGRWIDYTLETSALSDLTRVITPGLVGATP